MGIIVAQMCKGERKGSVSYQGPLGTDREITKHKEIRVKLRSKMGGAVQRME
jgi:hypothetical protein